MAKQSHDDKEVDLAHCFQGEYEDSCKYGDRFCPADKFAANQEAFEVAMLKSGIVLAYELEKDGLGEYKNKVVSSAFLGWNACIEHHLEETETITEAMIDSCKQLKAKGLTYGQIAERFGVEKEYLIRSVKGK